MTMPRLESLVSIMRFSSAFPSRNPQRQAARPERAVRGGPHVPAAPLVAPVVAEPVAAASQEPPDDLDQRVRLMGEWQMDDCWA
jgi:hypothetical protein